MSPTSTRCSGLLWTVIAWGLLLAAVAGSQPPAQAQSSASPDSVAVRPATSDSADALHPNTVPYESSRSIAYHALALPAYVLHGVTRPVGWTVLYVERTFPELFELEPWRRGIFPLLELGGPAGTSAGAVLYDNHLFGTDQQARLEGKIGARNFFELRMQYERPRPLGAGTRLNLEGNFFSEPRDRFYVGGMNSDRSADAARFAREQVDARVRLQYKPEGKRLGGAVEVRYEHIDARLNEGGGQQLVGRPGLTATSLLTPRVDLDMDLTEGRPRTHSGTALGLQLDYTHALNGDRFRYGRYVAAIHQYVPVFIFPKTRRLALRAHLERVHPMWGGDAVPFYQLPRLGGQRSLRGFVSDRFRGDGALFFTAEYRYPVWSRIDAMFFVDAGQVFDTFGDIAVRDFEATVGGGFHLLNNKGLSARFEVARSVEGTEVILTVRPAFRRL